jgi:hypothetical protein
MRSVVGNGMLEVRHPRVNTPDLRTQPVIEFYKNLTLNCAFSPLFASLGIGTNMHCGGCCLERCTMRHPRTSNGGALPYPRRGRPFANGNPGRKPGSKIARQSLRGDSVAELLLSMSQMSGVAFGNAIATHYQLTAAIDELDSDRFDDCSASRPRMARAYRTDPLKRLQY